MTMRLTRTLRERRQGIVRLLVWVRLVERDPNRNHMLAQGEKRKENQSL